MLRFYAKTLTLMRDPPTSLSLWGAYEFVATIFHVFGV